MRVLEREPIAKIDDRTIVLADVAEKALRQVSATVGDLLTERMSRERASRLAKKLATGTWTHDYPISADEARGLGIPVSTEMPSAILDLMHLYPQTAQRRPSVEYIPMPYGSRDAPQDARRHR